MEIKLIYIKVLIIIIFFLLLFCSNYGIEVKVNRIFKGDIKHNLYIIESTDSKNNKIKIVSFYDNLKEIDTINSLVDSVLDLNLNILPKEFKFEEILPSFWPIYDRQYQNKTTLMIDNKEYFNPNDTFYYTNCLSGLTYIPNCDDSTNLKKLLELGYYIDSNEIILKKIDSSLNLKKYRRTTISEDSLRKYFDEMNKKK